MVDTLLSIDDLQIGMKVTSTQLSAIYYTFIILTSAEVSADGNVIKGVIAWFGKELNKESDKFIHEPNSACIYNDNEEVCAIT